MSLPHTAHKKLVIVTLAVTLALALSSCATKRPMWAVTISPTPEAVQAAMEQNAYYPYRGDINPVHLPQFEPPTRLRPCCVFGMDVKISMKRIPIPIYQVVNVIGKKGLGPHTYDSGFFGGYGTDKKIGTNENNGVIYTCKGGFIDTAHVRDYSDLTIYLFFEFYKNLGTAFDVELKGELGPRVILVDPVEVKGGKFERARVAAVMASWTAYQLSLWHEIAQWHGYSEFSMFSEEPSAYSVEDAYSNLLGISIANGLIYSALVFNDNQYARNFDTWFQATLKTLGAVSEKESRRYMRHVDGFWWDSTKRLPEKFIVLKRNYNMGHVQTPFLVPDSIKATFDIPAPCPAGSPPATLTLEHTIYERPISDWVHIQLFVGESYRETFAPGTAFNTWPDAITPDEFQAIADADELEDILSLKKRNSATGENEKKATP